MAIFLLVGLVLFVPALLFVAFTYLPEDWDPAADPAGLGELIDFFLPLLLLEIGLLVVAMALYYVYYVELMFRSGQTVGKKVMSLRVVPLDPAGTLTRAMAARRYLVQIVAGTLLPGLVYLDGLWQLWDKPYQQCLHDKAADTVVVKAATR